MDRAEYQREWRKKNPEKVAAYSKKWRDNNRDKFNAQSREYMRKRRNEDPDFKERQRVAYLEWAKNNREQINKKVQEGHLNRKRTLREIKASSGCAACGSTDGRVLQFHHRDPSEKSFSIGNSAVMNRSWAKILSEVEKCDVLCANCHILEHWNEEWD